MKKKKLIAGIAAVLVMMLGLSGCMPTPNGISARADGKKITVSLPASPAESDEAEEAFAATEGLPTVGDYLMLRPSEVTIEGEIPETGVELEIILPEDLPEGALARFVYFEPTVQSWVPVETEVSGRKVTATVDHLSLWSVIITGPVELIADWADDAGQAVTDSLAWWSTDGPGGWIYRHGGLTLGLQASAPECDPGELPGWVEEATISQLTGIPEDNQNVLRCVGPDPENPELLQVKAVANRGYSFDYKIADGVTPLNMAWSLLPGMTAEGVDTTIELLGAAADSPFFLDPRNTLLGTSEVSFSVTKGDAKQISEDEPLVAFLPSEERRAATAYLYKYMLDFVDDNASVLLGIGGALYSCELIFPEELLEDKEVGEWVEFLISCLQELDEDIFEKQLNEVADKAAKAEDPNKWQRFASTDGKQALRTVRTMLKWVDLVTLGLTMIDYEGERNMSASFVAVKVSSDPVWEDMNGRWCNYAGCYEISLPDITMDETPQNSFDSNISFRGMWGGCFLGRSVPVGSTAGGASAVLFCPAGVPTESEEIEEYGAHLPGVPFVVNEDVTRDRMTFFAGGLENHWSFRE